MHLNIDRQGIDTLKSNRFDMRNHVILLFLIYVISLEKIAPPHKRLLLFIHNPLYSLHSLGRQTCLDADV